jgi:uncharacterized membrane protein
MESRAKVLGHPAHPMLVVFPLGLLVMSLIFDVVGLVTTGGGRWHDAAFRMIGAGVIGGLLAAIPGVVDWIAIPMGTRAKAVGLWHGLGNIAVITLFAIAWLIREGRPTTTDPSAIPIALSFIAVGLGAITAWLGGELVDRLGVGVDDGANLDAPSSLSGRPAASLAATEDRAAAGAATQAEVR